MAVWELKNAGDEQADLTKAYNQLQTYLSAIPALFYSNAFLVVSDGINSSVGTITSPQGSVHGMEERGRRTQS